MNEVNKTWLGRHIIVLIALFVTTIWGLCTIYLVARALRLVGESADLTAVLSVYSTITATFMVILNYYFGSSKGSQDKQEQINDLMKK